MANSIYDKQFEPDAKHLLLIERNLYKRAKIIDIIVFVFFVIAPLIVAIIVNIFNTKEWPWISGIVGLVILCTYPINSCVDNIKRKAGIVLGYFDYYVLGLGGYIKTTNNDEIVNSYIGKYVDKSINPEYYSDYTGLPYQEQQLSCVAESLRYDKTIRTYYYYFITAICLIFSIIILILGAIEDHTWKYMLSQIGLCAPLITYLISKFISLKRDIKKKNEAIIKLNEFKNYYDVYNYNQRNDILEKLQKEINDYRVGATLIPEFFYLLFNKYYNKKTNL